MTATLLPPLVPLHVGSLGLAAASVPSWAVTWMLRWMLVRVVFGMGKFKFSSGWAHPSNHLYLKGFMSWQPLPTPLAWTLAAHVPDFGWQLLHVSMWLLEVPLPALYLASSWRPRALSALLTIGLQVGIQLSGNYGLFNILTALLALPLLASGCGAAEQPSGTQQALALLLALLAALELPHNSYTTNSWHLLAPLDDLPRALQAPLGVLLALVRALKPFHLAHGYGVFTPMALRNFGTARLVLRLYALQEPHRGDPQNSGMPSNTASGGGTSLSASASSGHLSGDRVKGHADGCGEWFPIATRYNSPVVTAMASSSASRCSWSNNPNCSH